MHLKIASIVCGAALMTVVGTGCASKRNTAAIPASNAPLPSGTSTASRHGAAARSSTAILPAPRKVSWTSLEIRHVFLPAQLPVHAAKVSSIPN